MTYRDTIDPHIAGLEAVLTVPSWFSTPRMPMELITCSRIWGSVAVGVVMVMVVGLRSEKGIWRLI